MHSKKIVIAIVSHGQGDFLVTLLDSLNHQTQDMGFEVILIENLPLSETLIEKNFAFKITHHQNTTPLGFAANVNLAFSLKGQDADYFCIINPDVELPSSIFPALIECMEENSIDVISPIVLDREGAIQDSFRSLPTPLEIIRRRLRPTPPQIVFDDLTDIILPDWIAGLFMLIRSSSFENIGGFDERYRLYFEDVDFCLRAKLQGYRIAVLKTLTIRHDAQWQSRKSFRYLLYHIASAARFFTSSTYREYRNIG